MFYAEEPPCAQDDSGTEGNGGACGSDKEGAKLLLRSVVVSNAKKMLQARGVR